MATQTGVSLSAVLPLPTLEYDVQYMNTLVRILNFMIQQLQNPGTIEGNILIIQDRDLSTKIIIDPQLKTDVLTIITTNLPTSATGLAKGQLWVDTASGNVLKVVP